jgi:YVTN family beta-propeller protein
MKYSYSILLFLILFSSCRKDKPPVKENQNLVFGNKRVFIVNEGNFGFTNASLSLYNPQNNEVSEDVYQAANSVSPGDVMQSICENNLYYFIVMNNSQKIIAIDKENFQKSFEVSGMTSPRYMLIAGNSKAYVSNYYSNNVQVIDLNTHAITKNININGWTEEMHLAFGKAFITNRKSEYVYVVQTTNDSLLDSIQVGYGSNSIVRDKDDKLWVSCEGNSSLSQLPRLVKFNPANHQIESILQFPLFSDSPWRLKISGNGETLYYLNNGVYALNIYGNGIPTNPIINQTSNIFYGLGIDPENDNIYVADAIDYIQKGNILVYSKSGSLIQSFKAGIIPGDFLFDYP